MTLYSVMAVAEFWICEHTTTQSDHVLFMCFCILGFVNKGAYDMVEMLSGFSHLSALNLIFGHEIIIIIMILIDLFQSRHFEAPG